MEIPLVPGCRVAVSLAMIPVPGKGEEGGLGEPKGNGGTAALGITRILPLSAPPASQKGPALCGAAVGPKAGILSVPFFW